VTVVNKAHASKDGIYLNGYVVNLDYDDIKKFHRKKIRVTGQVILVPGIPKDSEVEIQGRYEDSYHIPAPQIEIVGNKKGSSTSETTTFTSVIDQSHAEKDGIHLNGYVVHLSYEQIRQLHGKKIRVSGEVAIIKAVPKTGPII